MYQVIERYRDEFPIRLMCCCLRVSASGDCHWSRRLPSAGQLDMPAGCRKTWPMKVKGTA